MGELKEHEESKDHYPGGNCKHSFANQSTWERIGEKKKRKGETMLERNRGEKKAKMGKVWQRSVLLMFEEMKAIEDFGFFLFSNQPAMARFISSPTDRHFYLVFQ